MNFAKFLRTPVLKNVYERLLLYFHYNSHHHYRYHHFHCHFKMHVSRLRILLTIPLDCYMIPCLFQLNFVFSSFGIYLSLALFQAFRLLRPVKGLIIRLWPPEKYQIFSNTYIYIYSYLHFLIYTYLLILVYTYFWYLCSLYTVIWTW